MNTDVLLEPDDQLEIQRFVDGELDELQQQTFLQRCEACPALWKSLALAFSENQLWDASLGEGTARPLLSTAEDTNRQLVTKADEQAERSRRPAASGRSRLGSAIGWLASLSACLLLGVLVGQRMNPLSSSRGDSKLSADREVPAADQPSPNERKGARPGQDEEFLWLAVETPDQQGHQTLRIPVRRATETTSVALMQTPDVFREDFMRELRNAGYELEQRRHIMPLRLPDGRRVILPVDNFRVRNVSHREFQ